MSATIFIFISMATFSVLFDETFAMPPAQCNPGFFDDIPPRIRKVCDALSTIYELGSAMENFVDAKGNIVLHKSLPGSGVKRQDVDHVFLRFG